MTPRYLKTAAVMIAFGASALASAATQPKFLGSFSVRRDASDTSIVKALPPLGIKINHAKIVGKDGVARYRLYKMPTDQVPAYLLKNSIKAKGAK